MNKHIIIFLCILFLLAACKEEESAQTTEVIRPVYAMQIGLNEEFGTRKFPGRASASNAVTLAFEVSGKLNKIPVSVGDRVKQGDILASLDPRDFQNTLEQAKAEAKRAGVLYARLKNALADNAVSKQEVSDAEAAYDSAKAAVKIRQKALEDTELKAPYDAIVTAKFIKSFGNVQAKQNAIRIVDPTRIEMVADIPEGMISLARVGMEILVEYDAFPGVVITARVSEISAEASQTTRTFPVTLIMDQPDSVAILPGMAGKAWRAPQTITENAPAHMRGFQVPLTAILSASNGQKYVWVINEETNEVNRTRIETGELTEHGVLVQGLKGGESIATVGVNRLKEGQKVRIIQE